MVQRMPDVMMVFRMFLLPVGADLAARIMTAIPKDNQYV
jgi:hypothetical protein